MVKTEQGGYEKKRVEIGLTDRKNVEILKGLAEGEKIVIQPKDGMKKAKEFRFKASDLKFFRK